MFVPLLYISLVLSVANWLPINHWCLEINRNLGAYYFIAHLIGLGGILITRNFATRLRRLLGILLFLLSFSYGRVLWPFYVMPAPEDWQISAQAPDFNLKKIPLKVLYANVFTPNQQTALLAQKIQQLKPDVIGLTEVNQRWLDGLALEADFPHKVTIPREDNFGVALFSRWPVMRQGRESVGEGLPPYIDATLRIGTDSEVRFIVLHTLPPVSARAMETNKLMIRRISTPLRHVQQNLIVLGDFNATPFSPAYQRFLEASEAASAMWAKGYLRTWDAEQFMFRFPIDHIFYKWNVKLTSFARLESIGSDHFPLWASFEID